MSKIALKKELQNMDKDQLIELILDHYSNRKDAKKYFEFFLNPDTDKLLNDYKIKVGKEFSKSKRSYSRCKVSVVKKQLAELESLNVGYEILADAILFTIKFVATQKLSLHYSASHYNLIKWFVSHYLDLSNRNLVLDKAIIEIENILNSNRININQFHSVISVSISEFLAQNKL